MAEPSAIQAQSLGCIKIARQFLAALLKSLTFGGHISSQLNTVVFFDTMSSNFGTTDDVSFWTG